MPTLDDIPILQRVTPSGDDLIPISDPSGTGGSQVRAIALNQISGLSAADVTTTATSPVTANRFTFITGGTTTTVNIPAPSGVLREIFVSNGGSGSATITAATATIRTAAAPTAATTVTLATLGYQHYMSDGTNWFRVH
jgi:hypothetical protein